jgi:hypothetical protein
MNPLVFMIVTAERDMKAQLEKQRLQDDELEVSKPAPQQTKQKTRKRLFFRLRSQKNCECS